MKLRNGMKRVPDVLVAMPFLGMLLTAAELSGTPTRLAMVLDQKPTEQEARATRIGTASIRGRVLADERNETPLRNARVTLTSSDGARSAFADIEGRFVFRQ